MSSAKQQGRVRGEAYAGRGHGALRRELQKAASSRIEVAIANGYYLEAIALAESLIADRLESRLSFLQKFNSGFRTLGRFTELKKLERDDILGELLTRVESWARDRNRALHEMVKVEDGEKHLSWHERVTANREAALLGFDLAKAIYHRVADLNPRHRDRVLPRPSKPYGGRRVAGTTKRRSSPD